MFAKISKSVLAAVTLTILILSAVFYWFIPGWILAALSFVWMLAEAARAFDRAGLFVLVPIVALLVLGAAGTLAVISVGTWLLTVRTGEFNQNFQNQSSGFEIVLAACIFLLCKQTCNRPPRAWVRAALGSVVSLSMAIYLMHNIFLSMLYSVGVSPRSFGGTVGVTLLVFAACFAVTKTVATVKPLCYLATGKTYAEACRSCNWVYTFRRLRGHTETKT